MLPGWALTVQPEVASLGLLVLERVALAPGAVRGCSALALLPHSQRLSLAVQLDHRTLLAEATAHAGRGFGLSVRPAAIDKATGRRDWPTRSKVDESVAMAKALDS